jgi:hypothetical protein
VTPRNAAVERFVTITNQATLAAGQGSLKCVSKKEFMKTPAEIPIHREMAARV